MIQSIQSYNIKSFHAFKGDENREKSKPSSKSFETHAGLKTGAVYSAIGTLLLGSITALSKMQVKNSDKVNRAARVTLAYIPVYIGTCLGCGAIVDSRINKKNADLAEKLEKEDKNTIVKNVERADITYRKNVFYNSTIGKTWGSTLGAVALPLLNIYVALINKNSISAMKLLNTAITGSLGGLILGAITDNFANRGASNFADKMGALKEKAEKPIA